MYTSIAICSYWHEVCGQPGDGCSFHSRQTGGIFWEE